MSSHEQFDGRIEAVGLGLEATAGTPVAPQIFYRWLDNDLQPKQNIIENESAMGTPVKVNDSEGVGKWVEGTLGGKMTDIGIGYLLYLLYGSVTSVSAGTGLYSHTFDLIKSSVPKTATLALLSPAHQKSHPYGAVDSLEIKGETGGWVTISAPMKARLGDIQPNTLAWQTEKEFTAKHVSIKIADTAAQIAAAPVLDVTSFTLSPDRTTGDPYFPLGTDSKPEFDRGSWEAKGEIVMRYKSTDFEEGWLSNAIKAMQFSISNGTSSLVFSGDRVRFRELTLSKGRDDIVTQTVSLYFEPGTGGKTLVPVLTNSQATYAPAA